MNFSINKNYQNLHSINTPLNDDYNSNEYIIEVENLEKVFNSLKAVNSINFKVRKGELFSLLGPNGAGKSTTIRMLTTVLKPTNGDAKIAKYSLKEEKNEIKSLIGVCPQENVIFEVLSAEENVKFVGRMHGMDNDELKSRSKALLEKMNIAGLKKSAKSFSGGMKRRLNLIMSLIQKPQILFLDEPSAGLDPQARRLVWDFIKELKKTGMTIFLTTHDMAEAEALSDHVAIIDHGKIIAFGTLDELKSSFKNGNILELSFSSNKELHQAISILKTIQDIKMIKEIDTKKLIITFSGGIKTLKQDILSQLVTFKTLHFREDSLEDIFLKLTGRRLRDS